MKKITSQIKNKSNKKVTTKKTSSIKKDTNFNFFIKSLAPIIVIGKNYKPEFVNECFAQLFNKSKKEITKDFLFKLNFYDFANHKIQFENLPFITAFNEKKNVIDSEIKYVDEKNNETWFRVNSFIVPKNKKEHSVLTFFTDITKEADLENIFRETISNISTVLFSTSYDGSELNFISEAVRVVYGYSPNEIYQNKLKLLRSIKPNYFNNFKNFINTLKEGNESSVEYLMVDRFGKEHWVRHTGVPIFRNNKVVRIVGMIQDITEEKITQLKLERSEEKFRLLIDTADDLIFTLNGFGYFNMVNKNGANALGYTPEEMIGRHFLEFIDKDDEEKVAEAFSKILNSSGITIFEALFLDRFDKSVLFEIHAKPIILDGEVSGMLSIGRNITNRKNDEQKIKELNAKLIEANRIISIERERARNKITVLEELNKLKSEFISNVSHELRTPLASIVGFAETITSDADLPKETMNEFVNIILSEGKRLAKLINDLLDFSKLESGEDELHKEQFSFIKITEEVIQHFEKSILEKNLTLSKEFPQNDIIINADKERIKKVISNILSNAIKFTNSGGRISILIQEFGKEVEIAISDTGIGIPENQIHNIFQKFAKITRPGAQITGAGFGLVSSKQIVDLHKGFIKVRSEENKGTTFIIRLPK
ncbi:MAG: PAS domain-containing sensor histidine kinase [Melioribacteraceae bacterium]|nr:PAS domain-containing sensor histidine kinase [Melioribacteraceae bacterium]